MLNTNRNDFFERATYYARCYESVNHYLDSMNFVFGIGVCIDLHETILDIFNDEKTKWEHLNG